MGIGYNLVSSGCWGSALAMWAIMVLPTKLE